MKRKAIDRIKDEIWCMDLAFDDELAKGNDDVKCLLARGELLNGTVEEEERKQNIIKKPFAKFDHDYKKESTQKDWLDKGTEFAGEF